MKQLSSLTSLFELGRNSHVPVIFVSLLSQFISMKQSYLDEDQEFDFSFQSLDDSVSYSIFQKHFSNNHIREAVIAYCVVVSISKVLLDAQNELFNAKNNVEHKKKEKENNTTSWLQFMPYVGEEEKPETHLQQSLQQLITLEEIFDHILHIAKRAYLQFDQKLNVLDHISSEYRQESEAEFEWVEKYFSKEQHIKRLQLLLDKYSSNNHRAN